MQKLLEESEYFYGDYFYKELNGFTIKHKYDFTSNNDVYIYDYCFGLDVIAQVKTKSRINKYDCKPLNLIIFSERDELVQSFIETYCIGPYTYVFCCNRNDYKGIYEIKPFTYSCGVKPFKCIRSGAYEIEAYFREKNTKEEYQLVKQLTGTNRFMTTKSARN